MDYLALCQEVARESGTVPTIGQPATVTGQVGRLQRVVYWVNTAWQMIQHNEPNWRWMNAEFSAETSSGTQEYTSATMGIADRFADWRYRGEEMDNLFSVYETAAGQADEGLLSYVEWPKFRRLAMVGGAAGTTGKPIYISVDDSRNLVLYPTPDGSYTIRGRYHKAPQELTADSDVPEMPEQFHRAIVYRALMLLAQFDEAQNQMSTWQFEFNLIMDRLRMNQLPRVTVAGSLA